MSDAVILSCILTHGDQAVVQGVNLHEVRLQKVLDGLNALLRFLLIGHFLMRDRAPALLHNLKHAQSLAYAHARILLALVHAGCTPVYCPSDTKHGHGGRCRQNQYMHAAVLSQSNETSTCRACFHVQPGSFPVAQSSTHSLSAPACRSHHASSALCGPAHTQDILSMIYVLGACLRAVTFWPCQSACFLTVYSMVTDTKHRAIVSDGSLQPIMPGWSLIPANSQSHSEAAACLLHILRVCKEKTPGACSGDT